MSANTMHHRALTRIIRKPALSINTISRTPRVIASPSYHHCPTTFFHTRANPPRIITATIPQQPATQRHFSSSASLSKKKDKSKKHNNDESAAEPKHGAADSAAPDPFDLTQLHDGISDALTRLKDELQKLRSGGRLNPEVIENLRVSVDKHSNETVKLGELAQVVPKGGRSVAIIVGEEEVSFLPLYAVIPSIDTLAARQTSQFSHHRLQPVPNTATRRTQCASIKRSHPAADQGIARAGRENG
jgi:hypothetical protein